MVAHLTQLILDALRNHGAWSVFVGVLIEQIIVPIPSPVLIMGAGFILISPESTWPAAFLTSSLQIIFPGVLASTLGALGTYAVGRYGGEVFVNRFHRYLGFEWKDVESIGAHFSRRGEEVSLFLLRAAPIVPLSLISLASGVLEIPLGLFVVWSVLGTIVRCYFLSFLGWQMGGKALELARGVDRFESFISVAIAGGVVAVLLYLRRRVRQSLSQNGSAPRSTESPK